MPGFPSFGGLGERVKLLTSKGQGGGNSNANALTPDEIAAQAAEERQRKSQEELEKKEALVEALLPWGLEQRMAVCLNFIKIPLIILVSILGSIVEMRVDSATATVYKGTKFWTKKGPACYVHTMDMDKWFFVNNTALDVFSHMMNDTTIWLRHKVNESWANNGTASRRCIKDEDDKISCEFLDTSKWGGWFNITIPKNMCGIDAEYGVCDVDDEEMVLDTEDRGGINHRISFIPHCLIWGLYKLLFLPIHPLDRIMVQVEGEKHPPSEPIFKLMTEPHFQRCTTFCKVYVMIVKIIRYSMLPNSLIVPLITMGVHPMCQDYFYYTYDDLIGVYIYYWMIIEFVFAIAAYVLGKTVYNSKCVGTWLYRCYKTYWVISSNIAFLCFIFDTIATFNIRFWEGLALTLKVIGHLDFDFRFSIDVVQLAASINVALDFLTLLVMILSLLCPRLVNKFFPDEGDPDGVGIEDGGEAPKKTGVTGMLSKIPGLGGGRS